MPFTGQFPMLFRWQLIHWCFQVWLSTERLCLPAKSLIYLQQRTAHFIMKLASSAFRDGHPIPDAYTRHGQGSSPPLTITEGPAAAKSLLLIVDDADAPRGIFTHWILFNIEPNVGVIRDNAVPPGATQGENSAGETHYVGPKPPSGIHRYFFRLFALDRRLSLSDGASRYEVDRATNGYVIAETHLVGLCMAGSEYSNSLR